MYSRVQKHAAAHTERHTTVISFSSFPSRLSSCIFMPLEWNWIKIIGALKFYGRYGDLYWDTVKPIHLFCRCAVLKYERQQDLKNYSLLLLSFVGSHRTDQRSPFYATFRNSCKFWQFCFCSPQSLLEGWGQVYGNMEWRWTVSVENFSNRYMK